MRRTISLTLAAFALACHQGADAPVEPTPTPTPSNELRILGGAVACDACAGLEFSIGGPDLQWVASATFVRSDDPRVQPRTRVELRRFTGDSGVVLQALATFIDSLPVGDYDLRLLTPGRAGGESMTLARALRVTRLAAPPGVAPPPPPPSPPGPTGTLRVSVVLEGPDPDPQFRVGETSCFGYYGCFWGDVVLGRPLELVLPATAYSFTLFDVAPNCRVTGPNDLVVTVVADSTVELAFAVSCVALGFVDLSVAVSGSDVQQDFQVHCGLGVCSWPIVRAPGPLRLGLAPGFFIFTLTPEALQPNCQVTGPNSVAVEVIGGATATVSFAVTCQPFGEIRVSVNSSDSTRTYRVQYPAGCDDYYTPCFSQSVRAGSPASIRVAAGLYQLQLLDVPANCTVNSANPASTIVSSGATTELAFDVVCP